jgi:predicted RNase H-like HicB family nuclease
MCYTILQELIMNEYTVLLVWDDEAYVWLASSKDVPGLALEAGSLDALMERVKYAIPDLLGLKDTDIKINFKAERLTEVHV